MHVGEAVTFGCTFERLVLVEGLNLLNRVVVEAAVSTRNHEMFAETSISRYINHPRCLEGLCWYDFCSWICCSAGASSHGTRQCVFSHGDESQLREHVKVHHYQYLEYLMVPEIVGPRLPDRTKLGNDDYEEQSELYYRMAALLYRPFRDPCTFLGNSNSAKGHFEMWRPFFDTKIARSLERHQQHYVCLQHAQDYRARDREGSDHESDSDEDEVCVDDDILPRFAYEGPEDSRCAVNYEPVPAEYYSNDGDIDIDSHFGSPTLANGGSPINNLLLRAIDSSPLPPYNSLTFVASAHVIARSHVRKFQTNECLFGVASVEESSTPLPSATTTVTIQTYHEAIRNLAYE